MKAVVKPKMKQPRRKRDVIQRYLNAVYKTKVVEYENRNAGCFVCITARRECVADWEHAVLRLDTWKSYEGLGKASARRALSRRRLLEFEKAMGLDELAEKEIEAAVRELMLAGAYPIGGEGEYPVKHPAEYKIRKDIDDWLRKERSFREI